MTSLLLAGLLITPLIFLVINSFRRTLSNHDVVSLPCPPRSKWIWGHELEAFERSSGEFYNECIEANGSSFRIKGALGHKDILVLADPKGVSHVYHNIYNYPHAALLRTLIERLLGRGLPWTEGEAEHKRMRRMLGPAFSVESVKLMTPIMYESAAKTRIANEIMNNGGKVTINMYEPCSDVTLDIIGKACFDHDFDLGSSQEAKQIAKSWKLHAALSLKRSTFIAMLTLRLFPFLISLPFEAPNETKPLVKQVASKMVEDYDNPRGDGKSLLSILLRASLREQEPISKEELLDQICTFVVAGHETTASSLAHTLWALSRHPETQKRLREEIISFPGDPTYEELQTSLPYLDACCKEGLRLFPAASHMDHVVGNDDIIPLQFPFTKKDGTKCFFIRVKKGQVITLPISSMNRLNLIWGDGETFRPERWLGKSAPVGDVKFDGWSNLVTFGDGPRQCIGFRLAVLQLKVLLITFIRTFTFRDTEAKISSRFAGTMQPLVVGRESEGTQLPLEVTFA